MTLATQDIEAGYENEEWLGFGYLGSRRYLNDADRIAADRHILREANRLGWTADEFFAWMNSKYGRWMCDGYAGTTRNPAAKTDRWQQNIASIITLEGLEVTK